MEHPINLTRDGHVATLTLHRPPHNFVDPATMAALADAFAALDEDADCRAIVLAAEGKSFCAGADFSLVQTGGAAADPAAIYVHAMRLFDNRKPIVAAVHGAAIGAGAGLALVADFRVTCAEARFSVNFNRLGFHPGFGLSHTLPRLIGMQQASLLFYTGRRIGGEEAVALGMADMLVDAVDVLPRAQALAKEIATSAPLAVQSTRVTLRGPLAAEVRAFNQRELAAQKVQFQSADFREGVAAIAERRTPLFTGR
ncbi:enoyl-CoA hydratase/isomerase family protein [soil metagenome]